MGYFRAEGFEDVDEWARDGLYDFYELCPTDWPSFISSPDKSAGMRLNFLDDVPVGETSFWKTYANPWYFNIPDAYGKKVAFGELVLSLMAVPDGRYSVGPYSKPEGFFLTMSIWYNDDMLREWFIPVRTGEFCAYRFDLMPLIEAGYDRFNEVRFSLLFNPGRLRLYFGDLWVMQDEVEHNLVTSLTKLLHVKMRNQCSELAAQAETGATEVLMSPLVDLHENTAVIIGDPDGNHELHVIDTAPYDRSGVATVTFTGEFDTKELQQAWPANTPVWFAVPAVAGDLADSEAVFPVFHIVWSAPTRVDELTDNAPVQRDSYVRDELNGHQVAVRKPTDSIRMGVEIHVWSSRLETAVEMWRYLRGVFDDQNRVQIGPWNISYEIMDYRRLEPGANLADTLPHYVLELDVFSVENVHERQYQGFPALKVLTQEINVVAFAEEIP